MSKKIFFLIILAIVLFLPVIVAAQNVTAMTIVDALVKTTLYVASGIVVILWVVTGILFLAAQGAPEKLNTAKKALFAAIAGTALVIVAGSAIYLVGQATNIPIPTTPAAT